MIRFLSGWLRTWVRPNWFLAAMAAYYILLEGFGDYLRWKWPLSSRDFPEFSAARDVSLLLFMVVAGGLRAGSYHPLFWIDYGRWLARTPWRLAKPLPLRPIHLMPGDIVFLFVVVLLLHNPYFNLLCAPLLFLASYLVVICIGLWQTEARQYAYALLFGLGLVARLWIYPWAALGVAALLYPVAYFGLRRSLTGFPWSRPELLSNRESPLKNAMTADLFKLALSSDLGLGGAVNPKRAQSLGWPFDLLRPVQPRTAISWREGTAVSLLLGWWIYAVAANPMELESREILLKFSLFSIPFSLAVVRIGRYCFNFSSPISAWGRLLTLRWLIPSYDKVFVAPMLAIAIPVVIGNWLIIRQPMEFLFAAPILVACASMIVLNCGPTLQDWRHTGNHRIVPRFNPKTHFRL